MEKKYNEIYISIDIESDGPAPGEYSMLSIGVAALDDEGNIIDKFYRKLKKLPEAKSHPSTMEWWRTQPEAWKEVTKDAEDPKKVMEDFADWLERLKKISKDITTIGMPVAYDFMFVHWYLAKFVDKYKKGHAFDIPTGFNGIDIRTFGMALFGKETYRGWKLNDLLPDGWQDNLKDNSSHKSIEDAIQQGKIFIEMLKEHKRRLKQDEN